MSLDNLKDPVVVHILSFVSTVPDFHSCARTCSRLRTILQFDPTWKHCDGEPDKDKLETNRQRAERHYERLKSGNPKKRKLSNELQMAQMREIRVNQIRLHQRGSNFFKRDNKLDLEWNFILKVLGAKGWRGLLSSLPPPPKPYVLPTGNLKSRLPGLDFWEGFLSTLPPSNDKPNLQGVGNYFRWDTMICLAHIVQSNLVDMLESTMLITAHRVRDHEDIYPVVDERDLALAQDLRLSKPANKQFGWMVWFKKEDASKCKMNQQSRAVIQHLLRLSGIPQAADSVVPIIWRILLRLTRVLIEKACIIAISCFGGSKPEVAELLNRTMPEHVERAASHLELVHARAYGVEEALTSGNDDTFIVHQTGKSNKQEDPDLEDCETLCSSGEDDNFSIYSDKDCPSDKEESSIGNQESAKK